MLRIPIDFVALVLSALRTMATSRWPQNGRRFKFLILMAVVQPVLVTLSLVCLGLDHLFYPGFRKQEVHRPIFIVGNLRTGTTYLQRLLAQDSNGIATFRMIDMFLPSILQKRVARHLGRIDARLGGHGSRLVQALDRRFLADFSRIHDTGFLKAEEDEFLFLYGLKSAGLFELFPDVRRFRRFLFFDDMMPAMESRFALFSYRALVKRHLYHLGGERRFMAKNPLFTGRIRSLVEEFPDARIVCTVRSPFQTLPSTASLLHFIWWETGALAPGEVARDLILEICRFHYDHPRKVLPDLPADQARFVLYEDLMRDAEGTVRSLWEQFGYPMSVGLDRVLREETRNARPFRSAHVYSGERFDMNKDELRVLFADVFEEYGFDTEDGARSETA